MKKRLLSLALVLTMCISLLSVMVPHTVYAESYTVKLAMPFSPYLDGAIVRLYNPSAKIMTKTTDSITINGTNYIIYSLTTDTKPTKDSTYFYFYFNVPTASYTNVVSNSGDIPTPPITRDVAASKWYSQADWQYGEDIIAVPQDFNIRNSTGYVKFYTAVKFDANNGTGTMTDQYFALGEAQELSTNTFTREGFTFAGWNTKADGTGDSYTDKQEITVTSGMTLYAKWVDSSITTGTQTGALTYGTASSATYDVTLTGVTEPDSFTIAWYDKDDQSICTPTGVTTSYDKDTDKLTVNTTAATSAGTYKFTLTSGGITSDKATLTVDKVKVTVPAAETSLVYNGSLQTGVALPTDAKYTLTGNTGTNADSYTATATLTDKDNYVWNLETPTSDNQSISWSIAKKDQTLSFTKSKIDKDLGDAKFTQTVTGADTDVTYSISNDDIATVDDNGTVTILKEGKVTITATAAETTNYKEATASYTLTIRPKTNIDKSNVTVNGNKLSASLTKGNTSDRNIDFDMSIADDAIVGHVNLVKNQDNTTYSNKDSGGNERITITSGQNTIDPSNYVITSGSIKISLKKDYLDTLAAGTHDYQISIKDNADITYVYDLSITINNPSSSSDSTYQVVKTGVEKTTASPIKLVSLLSLVTIAGVVTLKKRKH